MTYMMAAEKMLESVIENFVFCSFSHGIVLNRRFRIHKAPDLTFFFTAEAGQYSDPSLSTSGEGVRASN